ncbi:hypothetical protein MNL07_06105 [Bartonella krasnovii]|uniref:Uncharacterized protein n=1 Tax=Bartonella krasnovii TaxID=2267275 RepID=A0A5B9D2C8_9HYPH|nr:hypothetical protein [Bartonella krasnovii]QEE12638.1 hypothetical protein D1092_06590 [Bartonella krasnovii]UNF43470.1 hypothetical protein MNL07_06105 [Bartonella krasnovii]UNF46664.1 hypothetical protein MNL05_06210 [Bartonella krasnovii]
MNETFQNLDEKVSEASSAFDTESRVLAFKEAIALSSKDYKIIFCIFVISMALGSVVRMLGEADREFDILTFICIFIAFIFFMFFYSFSDYFNFTHTIDKEIEKNTSTIRRYSSAAR